MKSSATTTLVSARLRIVPPTAPSQRKARAFAHGDEVLVLQDAGHVQTTTLRQQQAALLHVDCRRRWIPEPRYQVPVLVLGQLQPHADPVQRARARHDEDRVTVRDHHVEVGGSADRHEADAVRDDERLPRVVLAHLHADDRPGRGAAQRRREAGEGIGHDVGLLARHGDAAHDEAIDLDRARSAREVLRTEGEDVRPDDTRVFGFEHDAVRAHAREFHRLERERAARFERQTASREDRPVQQRHDRVDEAPVTARGETRRAGEAKVAVVRDELVRTLAGADRNRAREVQHGVIGEGQAGELALGSRTLEVGLVAHVHARRDAAAVQVQHARLGGAEGVRRADRHAVRLEQA